MTDPQTRCGTFVLAGRPNAGKSTLLNAIMGEKLAIVSPKPQSSRSPVVGIRTDGPVQLIFVDPPGLLEPHYLLQETMLAHALDWLQQADGIIYLHPADQGEPPPLASLVPAGTTFGGPVLTVMTKGDLLPAHRRGGGSNGMAPDANRPHSDRPTSPVVSAVQALGLETLLAWCRAHAPMAPFRAAADDMSNQPLRFFVTEFVREAAFEILSEELPYAVAAEVEEFRESRDPVYIRVSLYVERESQKGMVIGSGGRTIRALGTRARHHIEMLMDRAVYLDLWVKVLPKWRTSPDALRQLGFPIPVRRHR